MILPSKHLAQDRALLTVGADVLKLLTMAKTVSRLWTDFKMARGEHLAVTYDWFILAIDVLFALGIVEFERGLVTRAAAS